MSDPDDRARELPRRFELFDLSVHLGPAMVPWISASSRMGVVHGVPRASAKAPELDQLLDLVYDYGDSVHYAEPDPAPEIAEILGDLVFGDPEVLELFQATRGSAADRERSVLVRILASPHLATLPWELLPDPARARKDRGDRFLALAPDAHVARLARGRTYPTPTRHLEPPLNLLVALSSPASEDPADDSLAFDIFEVKRSLLAELQPLEDAGLLVVDVEDRPTLENLRRRVGSKRRGYHLFHYVGHALPDSLILEDEAGRREDQASERFAEILRLCPDLRLMVFAGCETARPAGDPMGVPAAAAVGWKHLLSLSDRCVQGICPVVIGMQAVLPFRTERLFTRFFYQGIATGYSIADAVRLARGAIRGDRRVGGSLLDWSVPVMFLGGTDPNPLVERTAAIVPRRRSVRHDLKLGLRQRDDRFFARDVPLRQAVDVLMGRTRERVLVITGPRGVGKTSLVDRALEEIENETRRADALEGASQGHVLYVKLGRLAPELATALASARAGDRDFHRRLADYDPDRPLRALCGLVSELLARDEGAKRYGDGNLPVRDLWDRLVEELTRTQFIVVLDDVDLLDELELGCLFAPAAQWLADALEARPPEERTSTAELLEVLLAGLRGDDGQALGDPRFRELMSSLGKYHESLPVREKRLLTSLKRVVALLVQHALDTIGSGVTTDAVADDLRRDVADHDRAGMLALLRIAAECRASLSRALGALAERRTQSRIVVVAAEAPADLLAIRADERFEMRIGRLTWPETWRWIRRNLPGLVGLGESYLMGLWSRLGTDLGRWEELERAVLSSAGRDVAVDRLVEDIVPPTALAPVPSSEPATGRRGERPLRIAVAGPYIASPQQVADALARLATEHGVGGRVVVGRPDNADALAVLIDEPSPFGDPRAPPGDADVLEWLKRAGAQRPDLLLLDYGRNVERKRLSLETDPERKLLRNLAQRCLLVAAGGNEGLAEEELVSLPAVFPEVLAVGPLRADGTLQAYASRHPDLGKPDLFMEDHLEATALYQALNHEALHGDDPEGPTKEETEGSTFAAFHAVAAAVLVWSLLPQLTPRGLRRFLVQATTPVEGDESKWAKRLELDEVVAFARRRVVENALAGGECSIPTLSAITGLDVRVVKQTLEELRGDGAVRRLRGGRIDRFVLVPA